MIPSHAPTKDPRPLQPIDMAGRSALSGLPLDGASVFAVGDSRHDMARGRRRKSVIATHAVDFDLGRLLQRGLEQLGGLIAVSARRSRSGVWAPARTSPSVLAGQARMVVRSKWLSTGSLRADQRHGCHRSCNARD